MTDFEKPVAEEKKFSGKGKGRNSKTRFAKDSAPKHNAPTWYMSPDVAKTVADLPFSNIIGLDLEDAVRKCILGGDSFDDVGDLTAKRYAVPGVMSAEYYPWLGADEKALNIAKSQFYTNVRGKNTGSAPYEPQDLLVYLISWGGPYSFLAWMIRVYKTLNAYSAKNRYLPKALMKAQHASFDDIQKHQLDLYAYIVQYANKLSQLCVPSFDNMPLHLRYLFLNTAVIADGDDEKSQVYLPVMTGYFKFQSTSSETGSALSIETLKDEMTFEDIVAFGNDLIDDIIVDADCQIMSGDILKRFEGSIAKIVPCAQNDTLEFHSSKEYLDQLRNAYFIEVGEGSTRASGFKGFDNMLYQDGTTLKFKTLYAIREDSESDILAHNINRCTLNFDAKDVTPEDIIEGTRSLELYSMTTDITDGYVVNLQACSDAINAVKIWQLKNGVITYHKLRCNETRFVVNTDEGVDIERMTEVINLGEQLASFRYAPSIRIWVTTSWMEGDDTIYETNLIADHTEYENYTQVTPDVIQRMNFFAIQGLLGFTNNPLK